MVIRLPSKAGRTVAPITSRLPLAAAACACLLGAIGAFADTELTDSVIANGGSTAKSPGGCYKLIASVGQPAAGSVATGGTFSLRGGFLAGNGDLDSLFHQGFEECT